MITIRKAARKSATLCGDGTPCQTTLRNYRRDGTMFWNEVTLAPLRDASTGRSRTLRASIAKWRRRLRLDARGDARDPSMNTQTMLAYLRDDKLTGLLRRPYFEELVKRDWGLAQRESRRLSFLVFDLDHYSQYRDVFGRRGADQSFRRIARVIGGCFRRASDLCGRFDEDQIAALTTGLDLVQASKLAEAVLARVRDLAIHHPRSAVSRYVTASAGVVSLVPPHDADASPRLRSCAEGAQGREGARHEPRRQPRGRVDATCSDVRDAERPSGSTSTVAVTTHTRAARRDDRDHAELRMIDVVPLVAAHPARLAQHEALRRSCRPGVEHQIEREMQIPAA